MERQSLYFDAPGQACLRIESLPAPRPGEAQVRTLVSAISPGTEMLFYRGQFPHDMPVDASIKALNGQRGYPLKYGYAAVGEISALGPDCDPARMGQRVFAFNPHETAFNAPLDSLLPIPEEVPLEEATFLPNTETAVNLVLDAAPLIGERVVLFGAGVIGLLTTAILSHFPLHRLIVVDRYPLRREAALRLGAHAVIDPFAPNAQPALVEALGGQADLAFELSGAPATLDAAIAAVAFSGRVVIGSWYGLKRAPLDLGGRFHRSRIRLISSQVSTIAPELTGRWDFARRFGVAWEMISRIRPGSLITQRLPFRQAASAYQLLDQRPQETIQILFTYGGS
jgi:threonine dehydrogenase-like Zn-dependent dehydrogenase